MSATEEKTVVVVGGGPAGMAAATAMLRAGMAVTLIDESPGLGGQYYKQYTAAQDVVRGEEIDELHHEGLEKAAALTGRFTRRSDALTWAIFPDRQLALYVDGQVELMRPDAVVLAAGAVERVAAFPGWTLPGVMTAGGAQTMISREAILPGKRFLLAGTGPLLLAIAVEIAQAGGEVVAVVEGTRLAAPIRQVGKFIRQTHRMRQAFDYHRALRRMGIPVLSRHTVVAAHGDGHVRQVDVARIDGDWNVIPGGEQHFDVDTLCLHYGFASSTELARLVGCDVAYDAKRGGWYAAHDDGMRATTPGIYVAGQVTGIGGADLAEATGRLAGLSVARDLGYMDDERYESQAGEARREVTSGRAFSEMLNTVYTPGVGIASLIKPETLVCRCEEVPAAQVDHAIAEGATTLNDVKRHTRCGMGFCQGRICAQILTPYLAARAGVEAAEVGQFRARPPVKPVPLGALATMPDPEPASVK